jgi:adenylylsulfate kinase
MTLETRSRSLAKALSWRLSGSVATTLIVWMFTRRLELAVGVGLIEILGKMVLYFVHERIWARIPMGREALPARTVLVKGQAGLERSQLVATIQSTLQRHGLAACQVGESLCSRAGAGGAGVESKESRGGSSRSGIARLRTACNESGLCLIGESDCSEAGCPDCSFTPENACLIVEVPETPAAISNQHLTKTSGDRPDRCHPSGGSPRTALLNGKPIGIECVGREVLQAIKAGVRR